jgi:hypothetical protein
MERLVAQAQADEPGSAMQARKLNLACLFAAQARPMHLSYAHVQALLTAPEAEQMVQHLRAFSVDEVRCMHWDSGSL